MRIDRRIVRSLRVCKEEKRQDPISGKHSLDASLRSGHHHDKTDQQQAAALEGQCQEGHVDGLGDENIDLELLTLPLDRITGGPSGNCIDHRLRVLVRLEFHSIDTEQMVAIADACLICDASPDDVGDQKSRRLLFHFYPAALVIPDHPHHHDLVDVGGSKCDDD